MKHNPLTIVSTLVLLLSTCLMSIANAHDPVSVFLNGLPMLINKPYIELCSVGPRLKMVSLLPFNGSYGAQIYFLDGHNKQIYDLRIPYFDYNWLPAYGASLLEKSLNPTVEKSEVSVSRRVGLITSKTTAVARIAIRDHVMFERFNDSGEAKPLYRFLAFSNELIGCPPILCYNPTLDAADYNEYTKKYQYFRGFYYWETGSLKAPGYNDAKLIMHDFDGVPPYIDAMTSLVIDNKPVLIFIRENLVLITPKTGGMLWEFELNEVFPASPDFNDQYFIDDIIRLSNTRLLLALGTTFCTFELHRNQQWKKPYLFTSFGCSSLDTGGMLAYIDAAMTAPRDRIPFVIVFNDWHVYEFPLDQFSKNVKENVAELKAIGDKSKKYPHLYWSCERSMYRGFVLDRKHYEATYIEQLSKKHEATAWKMIKSGARSYDMQMVYILMSVIATFLALCYGMLVFIGIFYCVMSETIRNKIRHRGGDKPLAPESITQEAIMAGKVTASQLLNAGMITPSALQNMTSKASKIGPDYSSGIRGSRVDGPGNALASRTTGSRVQDEGKSKMGSAIRSQVGSRKSAVVGSKVGSHISKKE